MIKYTIYDTQKYTPDFAVMLDPKTAVQFPTHSYLKTNIKPTTETNHENVMSMA